MRSEKENVSKTYIISIYKWDVSGQFILSVVTEKLGILFFKGREMI